MLGAALGVIGVLALFGWALDARGRRVYLADRRVVLTARAAGTAQLLRGEIAALRRDLILASRLPITRSIANSRGTARGPGERDAAVRQLEETLVALLDASPRLTTIRLAAESAAGGEIVRVDRVGDVVRVVPADSLPPGVAPYAEETAGREVGSVFLSGLERMESGGSAATPPRRVIRAATPLFARDGSRFGALLVEMDIGSWIDEALRNTPDGMNAWIASGAGDDLTLSGALGSPPGALAWLVAGMDSRPAAVRGTRTWDSLPAADGVMYTARARVNIDGDSAGRASPVPYLVVAYGVSETVVRERLAPVRLGTVLGAATWAVLLLGSGWLIARWALRPLRNLRVAADRIGAGEYDAALDIRGRGELGALAGAFRSMVSQIRRREEETHRAADALRDSERRFRETLDDMQEGCQIIGFDWRYLYVNESVARHGRRRAEELLGRTMMEAYPGIEQSPVFAALRRCMEERITQRLENEFVYEDGTSAWFDLTVHPSAEGIFVTSYEITGRKRAAFDLAQAAAEARRERDRAEAILQVVPDAVVHVDAGSRIAEVNVQAESLFGYSREELIGEPFDVLVPERLRPTIASLRDQMMRDPSVLTVGMDDGVLGRRKDGGEFRIAASLGPLSTPEGWAIVATVRDVTDRWHANRRILKQVEHLTMLDQITRAIAERHDLRSIYQVVAGRIETDLPADLCCVCQYDGASRSLTVLCTGPGASSFGEASPLAERDVLEVVENGLARVTSGQLVYEQHIETMPLAFTKRLSAAGLSSLVMAPLRSESRVFGAVIVARRDPGGFSSGECELLRQTAEHVALAANQAQLHGALQEAYDDLRQSQQTVTQLERLRAMSEMASGVAHDINNALSPVLLYAELLLSQEPDLSDRAREYLGMIQQSIRSVSETVSRIREFSRPQERGRTPAPVDLNDLVQRAVSFTQARWGDIAMREGSTIEADLDLASDLPTVLGVDNEIRDALTNLILNAADALPNGGTIGLRTRRLGESVGGERPAAVVEVSDTGIGMDEDTARRCLEPFFTTKGELGTGLGLAMAFGTMQRHGGRIDITSAIGEGTTVRLTFPGESEDALESDEPGSALRPPQQLRLLLVDDDPVLLRALNAVLKMDGHDTVATAGGEAGLVAFRRSVEEGSPFDAVITDLGMPRVDGRQVAAGIKTLSPSTPVILLTGWGRRLLAENDIPEHVDQVLSKPPTLEDLRGALARAAGGPRGERRA